MNQILAAKPNFIFTIAAPLIVPAASAAVPTDFAGKQAFIGASMLKECQLKVQSLIAAIQWSRRGR